VINNGFSVNAGRGIDLRMGKIVAGQMVPYASVAEANAATPTAFRYKGLVKLIDDGTGMKEYWYLTGVADGNLVLKTIGGIYTAGYGMLLSSGAFSTDTTVIASKSRLSNELNLKQPLEDQRLSTTNSPIFNRIITSNTSNTDAVQTSFDSNYYNSHVFYQNGVKFGGMSAIGNNAGLGTRNGTLEIATVGKKPITLGVNGSIGVRVDSANTSIPSGGLSVGSNLLVYGNSIANGVGASVADSSYKNILSNSKGLTLFNYAQNGSCVADMGTSVFTQNMVQGFQSTMDLSVNDYRLHTSANHYTYYKYGLMDEIAWLGLRDSSKIKANGTSVTYTGTWTTPGVYGGLTRGSSVVASTASMRLKGSTILVSTINQNANTGAFTISVDGSVKYTWARPATNIVSVNGATFAPYLIPITGLYDSMHTVVITVTSITGGDAVYFNWAAGTSGHQSSQFEPSVYVNDGSRMTAAGYIANGGSDALCATYNTIIYDAVDFLASIGVNCAQVRGGSILDPLTDLADGIHPNDRGYRLESQAFVNKMNGIIYPKDRQRAGGSYTNGSINYNSNSLGFGTSGQVLTSGGTGVVPTWTTVSGGSGGDSSIHKWNLALTSDRTLNGNRMDLYLGGGGDSTVNLDTFSVNSNHGFSINDGEGGTIRTSGKDMYVTGLGHTQVSGVDSASINSNKIRINANDSLILQSQNTVDVMSDIVKIKSQGALFLESVSDDINITPPIANSLLINNLPATGDTTNNKPLGINSSGKVYEMNYWPSTGGGGSGTVNSGTQYRLAHYATTGTAVSEAAAITGNRLLISDVNGVPTHSAVTSTEAGYLTGITSSVQTQLSNKLNISDTATMLSGANVVHKTGTENVYGAKTFISTLTTNGVANTGGITSTGGISTNGSVTVGAGATGNTGLFWLSTGNGIEFVNPSGQTTQGMSYKLQHATGGAFTWIIGSGYSPRMRMGNGTGLVIMPAGADILPDVSTALDVVSTTKGVRLTPMTRTQADAISGKATGLELYSTTDSCKLIWNGTKFMYIGKSGTYVPTYTSTANIASTVVTEVGYSINGDIITLTGEVEFGITATLTATELRVSLPSYVTNNFTATKFGGGITYNDGSANAFTITPVSGTTLIAFKSASPNLTTSYKYPFTVAFRIP